MWMFIKECRASEDNNTQAVSDNSISLRDTLVVFYYSTCTTYSLKLPAAPYPDNIYH